MKWCAKLVLQAVHLRMFQQETAAETRCAKVVTLRGNQSPEGQAVGRTSQTAAGTAGAELKKRETMWNTGRLFHGTAGSLGIFTVL